MTTQPLAATHGDVREQLPAGRSAKTRTGSSGQNDFLKLMIAQLQAQNPLEPGNSNEYINELAQFTQVEQTTNLAAASELSGAVQLIGHTVSYTDASGETAPARSRACSRPPPARR